MTSTPSEPGYSNICITKTLNSILANTVAFSPQQQWGLKLCASWHGLDWWPPPPRRQLGGGSWPWGWRRRWRGRVERNGWRRWRVHVQGGQGETTATRSREDCFYMIDSTWFCISPILKPNFHTDLLILFYGINVGRRTVYWWYCS